MRERCLGAILREVRKKKGYAEMEEESDDSQDDEDYVVSEYKDVSESDEDCRDDKKDEDVSPASFMRALNKRQSFKFSVTELDTISTTCWDMIKDCSIQITDETLSFYLRKTAAGMAVYQKYSLTELRRRIQHSRDIARKKFEEMARKKLKFQ